MIYAEVQLASNTQFNYYTWTGYDGAAAVIFDSTQQFIYIEYYDYVYKVNLASDGFSSVGNNLISGGSKLFFLLLFS